MEFIKFNDVIRISALSLLLIFIGCSSTTDKVKLVTPFDEVRDYELMITRKKEDGQSGASGLYTETKVNFEVTEINEVLKGIWKYGGSKLIGSQAELIGEEEQQIINIYEGLFFDLEFEDNMVSLINYDDVRRELEQLFLKVYKIDSLSDESGMYQRIKTMFNTKAITPTSLMNTFFPEIPLLFTTMNSSFTNADTLVIDSIMSPYESSFIDIISTIAVEKMEGEYEIIRNDSISQDLLNEQMKLYMKEIFGEQAQEIPFSQMPKFNYKAQYSIWLNEDKKLTEMDKSMRLSNGGNEMSNSLTITIVD